MFCIISYFRMLLEKVTYYYFFHLFQVPSHLFEYFARTPSVVRQSAKHYLTNEEVPTGLVEEALYQRKDLHALEMQSQILYSAADMVLMCHVF